MSFQTILLSVPPFSLGSGITQGSHAPLHMSREGTQPISLGLPRPQSCLLFSVCPCDPTVCPLLVSHPLLVLKTSPLVTQDGFKLLMKYGLGLQIFLPLPPQDWVYRPTKLGFVRHWE